MVDGLGNFHDGLWVVVVLGEEQMEMVMLDVLVFVNQCDLCLL